MVIDDQVTHNCQKSKLYIREAKPMDRNHSSHLTVSEWRVTSIMHDAGTLLFSNLDWLQLVVV